MRNIKNTVFISLSFVLLASIVSCDESHLDKSPNVLIILTDDQGWADVQHCGSADMLTPNMNSLFENGLKFNSFYANSSVCSPTRASLLTGQYPDRAGVPGVIRSSTNSWGYLNSEVVTIADVLKKNGYRTGIVGKWHLGTESPNLPNDRGFDYFKGFLGDMMDDYWTHLRFGQNLMRYNKKEISPIGHATDLFSNWAADFIKQSSKSKKPFFLYLAYNAPHYPIQPPKEYLDRVIKRNPEFSHKRAELVAFIEHLDHGIKQVIDELKKTGQYDNTIIIFTSDNGGRIKDGANNGLFRDGKQSMYEGGLLVPTSIVWKNKIIAGTETDASVMTMDIMPTILDVLDIENHEDIRGISFSSVLFGKDENFNENRPMYFVRREGNTKYRGHCIYALQHQGWKIVYNTPFSEGELFNLENDPYEKENLINEYPDKFNDLNVLLMKYIKEGGSVRWQPPL